MEYYKHNANAAISMCEVIAMSAAATNETLVETTTTCNTPDPNRIIYYVSICMGLVCIVWYVAAVQTIQLVGKTNVVGKKTIKKKMRLNVCNKRARFQRFGFH